jgi:hypothetical protein
VTFAKTSFVLLPERVGMLLRRNKTNFEYGINLITTRRSVLSEHLDPLHASSESKSALWLIEMLPVVRGFVNLYYPFATSVLPAAKALLAILLK